MSHFISVSDLVRVSSLSCLAFIASAFVAKANCDPGLLVETEISSDKLKGSFVEAGEGSPIALIIPGSGLIDRDGNSPTGIRTDAYKQLAQGLAAHSISSVRVDKRGMFSSALAGDPNAVTIETYADDYGRWVDTVRRRTGAQCIYLLGHSEGGVMAAATASSRNDVCGLILLATPGRPLGDILEDQLRASYGIADGDLLKQALDTITLLEAGERVNKSHLHPTLRGLFHESVQGFLISMMGTDPAKLVVEAGVMTLVIQGGTDFQVSVHDATKLAEAEKADLIILPMMNHVLKDAPAERTENLATYSNINLPLAEGLVEHIADFVSDQAAHP